MFSDVVMEVPKSLFERVLDEIKEAKSAHYDTDLTADDLKEVITRFKAIYKDKMGEDFPQDPQDPADGGRKGCVPLLGQRTCHRIPPNERYPRRLGNSS